MLRNALRYQSLRIFRNGSTLFWNLLFPFFLCTVFYMGFGNIDEDLKLEKIEVGYSPTAQDLIAFDDFRQETEDLLIWTAYPNQDLAHQAILDGKISGYFVGKDQELVLVTAPKRAGLKEDATGYEETILTDIGDAYVQNHRFIQGLLDSDLDDLRMPFSEPGLPEGLTLAQYAYASPDAGLAVTDWLQDRAQGSDMEDQIQNLPFKLSSNLYIVYFFSLMAYACLGASFAGANVIIDLLPVDSLSGQRQSLSPISKGKLFLANSLAPYAIQLLAGLIMIAYLYVLNVRFGDLTPYVVLLVVIGTTVCFFMGTAWAIYMPGSNNMKSQTLMAFALVLAFLSGLMVHSILYYIQSKVPLLNKINPATLITKALYALQYYGLSDQYWENIRLLLTFGAAFVVLSVLGLRRKSYDRI